MSKENARQSIINFVSEKRRTQAELLAFAKTLGKFGQIELSKLLNAKAIHGHVAYDGESITINYFVPGVTPSSAQPAATPTTGAIN